MSCLTPPGVLYQAFVIECLSGSWFGTLGAERANNLFVCSRRAACRKGMKRHEGPTIIAASCSAAQSNGQGAVELSGGTKVPQNPSLPKLNLTNMQREQTRK